MQKHLTKIFTPLLVVLMVTSFFGASPSPAAGQTPAAQDKTLDIIENVLSVDLSKYTIELKIAPLDGMPLSNNDRKLTNLIYTLTPLESNDANSAVTIFFMVERDVVINYFVGLESPQVITTTQYANQYEAAKGFLEKYQTHTNIDSKNLITMLNNVDLTKNTTITKENTKLVLSTNSFFGEQTTLRWTHTVNGADYTALEISLKGGFVRAMYDTRALYTIGDTTLNISKEKAIDLAMENLQSYSYAMPDGSVVKDFKVSREKVAAVLATSPVDYVLRPYWDIRMMLDEVCPGSVYGITAFVWANTGEVFSYSNIAIGGAINSDNHDHVDSDSTSPDYVLMAGVAAVIVAVLIAGVIGVMVKKRRK
ncbi:MAG: hypothetical protein LBI79_01435 [Nitrososphaerota archaeon]|jgi:hypothetical protein|nr:hypothetical protein [Nitrososphaerota archaeon]